MKHSCDLLLCKNTIRDLYECFVNLDVVKENGVTSDRILTDLALCSEIIYYFLFNNANNQLYLSVLTIFCCNFYL